MLKSIVYFIAIMSVCLYCFGDDGDITQPEVRPDVVGYKLDTVQFYVFTQQCVVTYRKVDASDNPLGEFKVIFSNDTGTEFTDLITAINNGSNIKTTIKNAVKVKLGI